MGKPKTKRGEAHVRLYRHELECPAYRDLSPEARALLIEFRALYRGGENSPHMSIREMQRRVGIGQVRAVRAREELISHGFIKVLTKGSFTRKIRHATTYELTNEPPGTSDGPASKDYMSWQPRKNTVSVTDTDGIGSDYRAPKTGGQLGADGIGGDYRKRASGGVDGIGSDYTDSIPSTVTAQTRPTGAVP